MHHLYNYTVAPWHRPCPGVKCLSIYLYPIVQSKLENDRKTNMAACGQFVFSFNHSKEEQTAKYWIPNWLTIFTSLPNLPPHNPPLHLPPPNYLKEGRFFNARPWVEPWLSVVFRNNFFYEITILTVNCMYIGSFVITKLSVVYI